MIGKTPSEYEDIRSSIVPYVPKTREINVANITPSRDNFANYIHIVINTGDALITASNGGGGKTTLMIGTAAELRKKR